MKKTGKEIEQEFIQSFEEHSSALFRHAFFRVSNREVAIDLVQEGFTKTWRHISLGNVVGNMKAFLYQVLNNLIIDYYRKRKSESLDTLLDDGFDPPTSGHEEIIRDAEHREVMMVIEKVPPKDRDVIVLRYVDGLSVKDIAEMLSESENTVSVRLHRALSKVRKIINHE